MRLAHIRRDFEVRPSAGGGEARAVVSRGGFQWRVVSTVSAHISCGTGMSRVGGGVVNCSAVLKRNSWLRAAAEQNTHFVCS
jgi:hypothetical protein